MYRCGAYLCVRVCVCTGVYIKGIYTKGACQRWAHLNHHVARKHAVWVALLWCAVKACLCACLCAWYSGFYAVLLSLD